MPRNRPGGFTLIEAMLVIAIISIVAGLAINEFSSQVMLARRTEAVSGLSTLWTAQQVHYSETGVYASTFAQLTFSVPDGKSVSSTVYKGGRYTYQLSQPWGPTSFYCIATAQLDADPWPDILEVYEFGE